MNKMDCGIYRIASPSGKSYIGSSNRIRNRWTQHRARLRQGVHPNAGLQAAWDKHGEASMHFEVLLVCSRDMLIMYEQIAINAMNPKFNVRRIAESNAGLKLSAETRARMSQARMGKTHTLETRAKLSATRKGIQFSDEHRAALRRARAERGPVSEETKRKLSESCKRAYAERMKGPRA